VNKSMNRWNHAWSVAVAIVLATVGLSSPVLAKTGSSGTDYTLADRSVVEWSNPWKVDDRTSGYSQDSAGDVVTLLNGDTRFILTTYPGIVTPTAGRDALVAQYEQTRDKVVVVDAGESGSTAFGSQVFTDKSGAIWGSYSAWSRSADERTLIGTEVLSPIDDLQSALGDAQSAVAIDGVAVLADVDPAAVSDAMTHAEATGTRATPATKTTTSGGSAKDLDPAFIEAGLLTGESYESPQFGYAVAWNSPWILNPDDNEAVISNTSTATDALSIAVDGASYSLLAIAGLESSGSRPADLTATWASQDFLDQYAGAGTTVLLEDSAITGGAVVTTGPLQSDAASTVVTVREVVSRDGGRTIVFLTLIVPVDQFATDYESVQEKVTLDGNPAMGFFSTSEIVDVLP